MPPRYHMWEDEIALAMVDGLPVLAEREKANPIPVDEPGRYFLDLLVPYIDELLDAPDGRDAELRDVFGFVERAAKDGDEEVSSYVRCYVVTDLRLGLLLGRLGIPHEPSSLEERFARAEQYLGPYTRYMLPDAPSQPVLGDAPWLLWSLFPAIREAARQYWSFDLDYAAWESVFMYWVRDLIRAGSEVADDLRRVFDFGERLTIHGDRDMRDLIAIGFCENLLGGKLTVDEVDQAVALMQPQTATLFEWVEAQGWVYTRAQRRAMNRQLTASTPLHPAALIRPGSAPAGHRCTRPCRRTLSPR